MLTEKKPHKFFERFLDNDVEELYEYLADKQQDLLEGKVGQIPLEELAKYDEHNGATTQLGMHYNVFDFDHIGIRNLKAALADAVKEANEYYGENFEENDYMIHGWYNMDPKTQGKKGVNPLQNDVFFHDHMGGEGSPVFHGYYCVNAEPSITYYKIDGVTLFENHNKNNRAIVSETGHPHGRDDWFENKPRITIAYDIIPSRMLGNVEGQNWHKLK